MNKIYRVFYLAGREDIVHSRHPIDIDLEPLIDQVLDGEEVYKTTYIASKAAIDKIDNKKQFLKQQKTDISAAGGDEELAYTQFQSGRCDQLRTALEESLIEAMHDYFEEDPEDDEDDDDDDEEDETENPEDDEEDDDDDEEDEEDEDAA